MRQAVTEVAHRSEHLTELDALQPPSEAQLRLALRAALGDSCVHSTMWNDSYEKAVVATTQDAANKQQEKKGVERPLKNEGLPGVEKEARGVWDWPVGAQTEKKYDDDL